MYFYTKIIFMKNYIRLGALFGLTAVIVGAFGAHALKPLLSAEMLQVYHTGVEYQFYHALALLLTAVIYQFYPSTLLKRAGFFFTIGILLFSGSIYILSFKELLAFLPLKMFGIVTPIGGIFFILGWLSLLMSSKKADAKTI